MDIGGLTWSDSLSAFVIALITRTVHPGARYGVIEQTGTFMYKEYFIRSTGIVNRMSQMYKVCMQRQKFPR